MDAGQKWMLTIVWAHALPVESGDGFNALRDLPPDEVLYDTRHDRLLNVYIVRIGN
jgi:hypothetical protein